jgi:DNA-binding CsgD family transcriptional regulator
MREVHALEEALAHLGEVASKLLVDHRFLQDTVVGGDQDYVSQGEVPQAIAELLASATHTVQVVAGLPDLLGLLSASTPLGEAATGGPVVRVLGQDKLRADRVAGMSLRALACSGVQVATAPVTPPAIVIVDRRAVLMAAPELSEGDAGGAFLLRDRGVAGYLASAIDCFWGLALPLGDVGMASDGGLSPVDQALLRLLAQGKKQQEIARSLQLSVRTVSRRIADLKQELKAGSPLQAGMEAVRRGWL